jgi:hypothetical protein
MTYIQRNTPDTELSVTASSVDVRGRTLTFTKVTAI